VCFDKIDSNEWTHGDKNAQEDTSAADAKTSSLDHHFDHHHAQSALHQSAYGAWQMVVQQDM